MTAKDEFGERLRAAMKTAGMKASGTALANAFNRKWSGKPISLQGATDWVNGQSIPRPDRMKVLAAVLRTDLQSLQHGGTKPLSAAERRREWEDRISYAERETIEAFLSLPTPQRLVVRDVIDAFAKAYGAVDSSKQ